MATSEKAGLMLTRVLRAIASFVLGILLLGTASPASSQNALDTTLFVKNGASTAGLGLGGEGYLSYSIATTTGEGITNPATFTRTRRCVMVDNLRIY